MHCRVADISLSHVFFLKGLVDLLRHDICVEFAQTDCNMPQGRRVPLQVCTDEANSAWMPSLRAAVDHRQVMRIRRAHGIRPETQCCPMDPAAPKFSPF